MIRLIILHTLLAGLLVAAWVTGILPVIWAADKFYAIPLISILTLVGIGYLIVGRITTSLWLADKLPIVGLGMTVIGFLWAANGDLEGVGFKRDVIHALVGNFMGVAGYFWVELCVMVTEEKEKQP